MPALDETRDNRIRVAPSAPLELMWVLHFAQASHEHEGAFAFLESIRRTLGPELARLRGDDMTRYSTELIVLAHRSGTMLDLDLRRFFARIDGVATDPAEIPSLLSESPEELEVTRARLTRLRTEPAMRKRYIELLTQIWSAVESSWEEEGRAAVIAEAQRWKRALDDGVAYRQLLGMQSLWAGRPQVDARPWPIRPASPSCCAWLASRRRSPRSRVSSICRNPPSALTCRFSASRGCSKRRRWAAAQSSAQTRKGCAAFSPKRKNLWSGSFGPSRNEDFERVDKARPRPVEIGGTVQDDHLGRANRVDLALEGVCCPLRAIETSSPA